MQVAEPNIELMREMCQKLVLTQNPDPAGYVVLKNPWDCKPRSLVDSAFIRACSRRVR